MFNVDLCVRTCANCGAFPGFKRLAPLCEVCEPFLLRHFKLSAREIFRDGEKIGTAYSLAPWRSEESIMGRIVRRLKGGGAEEVYDYFAQLFLCRWQAWKGSRVEPPIFIPAPPRREGDKDHSYQLAESFARFTGGVMYAPLKRETQKQQKRLDKSERQEIKVAATALDAEIACGNVIFVDDVIVTGSTMAAAYEALRRPKRFMAWCLADRV